MAPPLNCSAGPRRPTQCRILSTGVHPRVANRHPVCRRHNTGGMGGGRAAHVLGRQRNAAAAPACRERSRPRVRGSDHRARGGQPHISFGALTLFAACLAAPTPARHAEIDAFRMTVVPSVTILVPSYKEDPALVWKTLLSAALQDYPRRSIVLLIDDPPGASP